MSLDVQVVNPLIALIAGILILLMPRLLNYVVAIYLIVIGVLGLARMAAAFHPAAEKSSSGPRGW